MTPSTIFSSQLWTKPVFSAGFGYLLISLVVLWPLFSAGAPPGVDAPTFLHLSWVAEQAILGKLDSPFTDPYWYRGFDYIELYPPVSYVLIGGLGALSPVDIEIWYRIVVLFSVVALGTSTFWLAHLFRLELWAAAWAGTLAVLSYPVIANTAVFGSLPAIMALPVGVTSYGLLKLAQERTDLKLGVAGGAVLAATLLTHHMTAVVTGMALVPLVGVMLWPKRNRRASVKVLGSFAGGFVAVSLMWAAFFVVGLVQIGFRREVAGLWSFDLDVFRSQFLNRNTIGVIVYPYYMGWVQVVLSLAGAVMAFINRDRLMALALSMLLLFWFSLGAEANFLISRFPFSGLDVSRFALYLVPFFAILSAYAVSQSARSVTQVLPSAPQLAKGTAVALAIAVLIVPFSDALSARDALDPVESPAEVDVAIDWLVDVGVGEEPIYVIGLGHWDSYWLPARGDIRLIDGWYDEGARNWEEIRVARRMGWTGSVDIERFRSIVADQGARYIAVFQWHRFEGADIFRTELDARPDLFPVAADLPGARIYDVGLPGAG